MSINHQIVGALAASVLAIASCNSLLGVQDLAQSELDAASEPDAPPAGSARVRILHVARALPAGGLIDVYLDEETTPRLPAHGGLSDYLTVSSSPTKISIRAQGQSGGEPLFEFDNLTFEAGTDTTAVLTGIATSLAGDEAVRLIPVVDGYAQAGTGMTQVRFLNAVVDLPTVSFDFDFYGEASPEISGLERFQATSPAGVGRVSDQAFRFGLVSNGTMIGGFAANTLPVGVGCLIVLSGKVEEPRGGRDELAAAMACRSSTVSNPSRAEQVVIVHVLGDVQPPATATLTENPGNRTIASSVGLRQMSTIWVVGEAATDWAMNFASRSVGLGIPNKADLRYLAILGGLLQPGAGENDASTQMMFVESAPTTGSRLVRFINMSADLGQVDLFDQANNQIADGATFGSFSADVSMAAGSYQLRLEVAASAVATFPFEVSGVGGATLLVLDGAETPTAGQRALRLTPIDLATWPPTTGTPIAPN